MTARVILAIIYSEDAHCIWECYLITGNWYASFPTIIFNAAKSSSSAGVFNAFKAWFAQNIKSMITWLLNIEGS